MGYCRLGYLDSIPEDWVELGFCLAKQHWGYGYATEAAKAMLAFGFQNLNLPEIHIVTHPDNDRASAVAKRLGMTLRGKVDWPNQPKNNVYSVKYEEYKN